MNMAKRRLFFGVLFWALAVICLFAPIVAWCVYRREEYFATSDSTQIYFGLVFAGLMAGLIGFGVLKSLDKLFSSAFFCFAFAGIFYCLLPIIEEIWVIFLCAGSGLSLFVVFRAIARPLMDMHREYRKEKIRILARKEAEADTSETTSLGVHM